MSSKGMCPLPAGHPAFAITADLAQVGFVKVFGERNTGTNFVVQAMSTNAPHLVSLTHEHSSILPSLAKRVPLPTAWHDRVYNAALDCQRAWEFRRNFGWKHAATDPAYLRAGPLFDRTLFIAMVRDPYYFLNSLYRRPYNILPRPSGSRAAFLGQPIRPNRRDRVGRGPLPSPMALWGLKAASYVNTAQQLPNMMVVRYEDVVTDFDAFFATLAAAGLPLNTRLQVPMASSKGDPMTFADYAAKTRSFDPRGVFDADELGQIAAGLDRETCALLGYPVYDRDAGVSV